VRARRATEVGFAHPPLRYTQALFTQMSQTAVCNRHHSLDQQLCRLLLLSLDRLASNQLIMTQELMANMLGVRREGVTEAAGKLQKLGVIRYSRGHIIVLDRPQLERLSCECYDVVKKETDRLLPARSTSQNGERPRVGHPESTIGPSCLRAQSVRARASSVAIRAQARDRSSLRSLREHDVDRTSTIGETTQSETTFWTRSRSGTQAARRS
jgi:hypothetical protein